MSSSHQPEPTGRPFYLYNDGWCISLPPLLRLTDSDFSRVFLTWKVESFDMWWHISTYLFFCSLSPPLRYEMLPHHGDQALSFDPREELFGNHSHLENCICSQTCQNYAIEATMFDANGITWRVLASLILLRPSASVSGQRKSNPLSYQLGLRKNLSAWHTINCAWKMRKCGNFHFLRNSAWQTKQCMKVQLPGFNFS